MPCCEFDDQNTPIEIPSNNSEVIYAYGSESGRNLNFACRLAKVSARTAMQSEIGNTVGSIQKFIEEEFPGYTVTWSNEGY